MGPKIRSKRLVREYYRAVPMRRRAAVHGKAMRMFESLLEDAMGIDDPVKRVAAFKSAMQSYDLLLSTSRHVAAEDEAQLRIWQALHGGYAVDDTPRNLPPHIAAVWKDMKAGDETAGRVVDEWIKSLDDSASHRGSSSSGTCEDGSEGGNKPS